MQTPKSALIRLGRGYSAVGTAVVERDPGTGRRMLHLRLCATAPDVYVPMDDDPAPGVQREREEDPRLSVIPAGHA